MTVMSLFQTQTGDPILYSGGNSSSILGIDIKTHQLVDVWLIGHQITALDCRGFLDGSSIFAAGDHQGKITLRIDWEQSMKSYNCSDCIIDLRLSQNMLMAVLCKDSYIYLFSFLDGSFFNTPPKKISISPQQPVSLSFVNQNKSILITTINNTLYLVDIIDSLKHKIIPAQDNEVFQGKSLKIKITNQKIKNSILLCFGAFSKAIVISQQSGIFQLYKNIQQAAVKGGQFVHAHVGNISDLLFDSKQKYLYSLGEQDSSIVQWQVLFIGQKLSFMHPFLNQRSLKTIFDQWTVVLKQEMLKRQVQYCFFKQNIFQSQYDQHIQIRGTKDQSLNKLLEVQTSVSQDQFQLSKRTPAISLHLQRVFGFSSFDKRDNALYIHRYPQNNHFCCQRHIIYHISRIVVIYDPQTNNQRFYQGHRFKITCMALHKDQVHIITGQSSSNPTIHLWNLQSCQPVKIFDTYHENGIVRLCWNCNCLFIISVGIIEHKNNILTFNIQMTDSHTGQILAVRNIGTGCPYSICCHPKNPCQFASVGIQNIVIWELQCHNLVRIVIVNVSQTFFTCASFLQFKIEQQQFLDLICGTKIGDIGVMTSGHFIILKQRAHTKGINCIKIVKFRDDIFIISTGQDQFIKIWNKHMILINAIDIRKTDLWRDLRGQKERISQVSKDRILSVASIDEYCCKGLCILLFATRAGDIIQLHFGKAQQKKQSVIKVKQKQQELPFSNNYKMNLLIRQHCSQQPLPGFLQPYINKRVFIALHPTLSVMISAGQDCSLFIWDVQKDKLLQRRSLLSFSKSNISCIKFAPDGDILLLGFLNGTVMFLDSKIMKTMHAKTEQRYQPPSLQIVNQFKQQNRVSTLQIEFSKIGEYVAVSYDNKQSIERFDSRLQSDGSFITIYVNKNKGKNKLYTQKSNYIKQAQIKGQQSQRQYSTAKQRYSLSACFMSFADISDKTVLIIYYQLVDQMLVRINDPSSSQIVIWDISNSTTIKSIQSIKSVAWQSLNFPNSIQSKYNIYPQSKYLNSNRIQQNPVMSAMSLFSLKQYDIMVFGSTSGDIHLVKKDSLILRTGQKVSNLLKEDYNLGKSYSGHISFINQIYCHDNYLFTTGINDESIFKWKIETEYLKSQLDNYADQVQKNDLYGQIKQYQNYQRDKVADINITSPSKYYLNLIRVIGRRASDRRNTLAYDRIGRIIYILGCNLIITDFKDNSKQIILQLDIGPLSPNAELSCFIQNQSKTLLITGTTQNKGCKLIIWDIYSKSFLKAINLSVCSTIMYLAISSNQKYVAFVGLTQFFKLKVGLIDIQKSIILGTAQFSHTSPCKIKDLAFMPNNNLRFLTCGIQHLGIWTFNGMKLTYQSCKLLKLRQTSFQQPQKFTFFNIKFIGQYFVTSTQKGRLFLWKNLSIIAIQKPLSSPLIKCIAVKQEKILIGCSDGKLIYWQLQDQNLRKIYQYQLSFNQPSKFFKLLKAQSQFHLHNPTLDIQSIDIRNQLVLVGTASGHIYQIQLPSAFNADKKPHKLINLLAQFYDYQIPVGVVFSNVKPIFYNITKNGLLSAWQLQSNIREDSIYFGKNTISLRICKKSEKIIIAFQHQLKMLFMQQSNFVQTDNQRCLDQIIDIQLAGNDLSLVVAFYNPTTNKSTIRVFQIENIQNTFRNLFISQTQNKIISVDYAIDCYHIIWLDINGQKTIIDALKLTKINPKIQRFELIWKGKGNIFDGKKALPQYYGDILQIQRCSQFEIICFRSGLILLDQEIGSSSYTNNLGGVKVCALNLDRKIVITGSQVDRGLMIWELKQR